MPRGSFQLAQLPQRIRAQCAHLADLVLDHAARFGRPRQRLSLRALDGGIAALEPLLELGDVSLLVRHVHACDCTTAREPYIAWKDTVNVPPREGVAIALRHEHPGLWPYHCHILDHEDEGMMGVLRVS